MIQKYRYGYAIWTDRADFINPEGVSLNDEKLLELRLFDEFGEYRAYRTSVDGSFKERIISDTEGESEYADFFYDEMQYLDIDMAKSNDCVKKTTGGGQYHIPPEAEGKDMLVIRYYCRFDSNGIAHICDWRLCGFKSSSCRKEVL